MPWCPKCKMEYREGVSKCIDCNTALVEDLNIRTGTEQTELVELVNKEDADKLVEYLKFSGISNVTIVDSKENSSWNINVEKEDAAQALKLYQAFKTAETTEEDKEEEVKKLKGEKLKNNTYVKKSDKYEDYKSSASMFLPFGIAGLIFITLNITGILHLVSSPLQYIVITALFLGFIYVGITSWIKLKTIRQEIVTEKDQTSEITNWLKENITPELLHSVSDESKSDEINYIYHTDKMKELIINKFGCLDENFVDQLVEDYYTEYLDE